MCLRLWGRLRNVLGVHVRAPFKAREAKEVSPIDMWIKSLRGCYPLQILQTRGLLSVDDRQRRNG